MAYLPRNFCRSDGCRSFGKFGWDPTVTGSLSSFFSVNSCCACFLQCCSSLAFTSVSPRDFILHILPFLLFPSKTTIINTHSLLVQYLPTISPFGIDGNTCIQHSTLLCIRPIRLESITETFRTRLLSPPLTSMSKKKHSFTELVAEHTPPVIYKHLGNPPDIQ
jgi:hypothetical protein